jgi:Cdc6-like AAA superfamily ATPase
MAIPIRNTVYDKIKEVGSLTDLDLYKILTKEGYTLPEDKFNKLLLDLEILGLIKVAWITKDERRIETFVVEKEVDEIEEQNKEMMEKDYEASFPGLEK